MKFDIGPIQTEVDFVQHELDKIYSNLKWQLLHEFKEDYDVQLFEKYLIKEVTKLPDTFDKILQLLAITHGLRSYSCEKCHYFTNKSCPGNTEICPEGMRWTEV